MALTLSEAVAIFDQAKRHAFRYVAGVSYFQAGALRGIHYDKPLWWETEGFLAVGVDPEEAVAAVRAYGPGPHLIGVASEFPDQFLDGYAALGYKTVPNEPIETVMVRSLGLAMEPAHTGYPVQLVRSDMEREFYNSAIDPSDPHQQMRPEELSDPKLRYYFVEQGGRCVCTGKAIFPTPEAVVVEPLATHADYRGLGIATALMSRLHADAVESGAEESVIIATQMGRALYEALGYGVAGYIQKFVPADH